jgi:hypothetical protein
MHAIDKANLREIGCREHVVSRRRQDCVAISLWLGIDQTDELVEIHLALVGYAERYIEGSDPFYYPLYRD